MQLQSLLQMPALGVLLLLENLPLLFDGLPPVSSREHRCGEMRNSSKGDARLQSPPTCDQEYPLHLFSSKRKAFTELEKSHSMRTDLDAPGMQRQALLLQPAITSESHEGCFQLCTGHCNKGRLQENLLRMWAACLAP